MNLKLAGIVVALAVVTPAQTFEVASVKSSSPNSLRGSEGGPGSSDPGQYRFNAATLQDLLAVAYKPNRPGMLSNNPVSGNRCGFRFDAAALGWNDGGGQERTRR